MSVVVVGTVALDTVATPETTRHDQLGGSASYASLSASYFSPVHMVSIVGNDFPEEYLSLFQQRGIDTSSVQVVEGGTFRWSGKYFEDMNHRETHSVAVNVLEHFQPQLADNARQARIALLANCSPDNQLATLDQVEKPDFVISDSMDLWIEIARERLLDVLKRSDLFVINDDEAKMFMETKNTVVAGRKLLELGPRHVVVKKGEHGALLFGPDGQFFSAGAYPLAEVQDPTGAGDCFIGGLAGYLSSLHKKDIAFADLARGIVQGTVLASFNCESFSTDRLKSLTRDELDLRAAEIGRFSTI